MTDTLPLLLPTLPGKVAGIVSEDPPTVQCQDCAATQSGTWHRIIAGADGFHFHAGWIDGTNPRLCRPCRIARHESDQCGRGLSCTDYRLDKTGSYYR